MRIFFRDDAGLVHHVRIGASLENFRYAVRRQSPYDEWEIHGLWLRVRSVHRRHRVTCLRCLVEEDA